MQSYWLNYERVKVDNPILLPWRAMKSTLYCNRNHLLSVLSLLNFYLSPHMYTCIIFLCIVIKLCYQHRSHWTPRVETQKGNTVITRIFCWKQTAVVAFQQIHLSYVFHLNTELLYILIFYYFRPLIQKRIKQLFYFKYLTLLWVPASVFSHKIKALSIIIYCMYYIVFGSCIPCNDVTIFHIHMDC